MLSIETKDANFAESPLYSGSRSKLFHDELMQK